MIFNKEETNNFANPVFLHYLSLTDRSVAFRKFARGFNSDVAILKKQSIILESDKIAYFPIRALLVKDLQKEKKSKTLYF